MIRSRYVFESNLVFGAIVRDQAPHGFVRQSGCRVKAPSLSTIIAWKMD
jgi:hypothetical protein